MNPYDFDLDEIERLAGVADPVHEAEQRRYIGPPQPTEAMFCGRLGEWSKTAVATSEAPRAAVFVTIAAYAATAFGRDCYLWIDNTAHHPRLFAIHVGRSSRARKGTAAAVTERLHKAVVGLDDAERGDGERVAPMVHVGGLSTREGLAWVLRDPIEGLDDDGNPEITDPGQPDKRLMTLESEFENVLQQGRRDGNTLSSALRDCFDGRDLAPMTKTNQTKATAPHVSCIGHITPHELLSKLDSNAISNGFLNRFLVFWAERSRLVPFPDPIPTETINAWAIELREAVLAARDGDGEMTLSQPARDLYQATYISEWSRSATSELVTALMERAPVVALRLAMTFALVDQEKTIGADHLKCGIAWSRYWRASVEYIWRDRARLTNTEGADADHARRADRIVAYLRTVGSAVKRSELSKHCFQRHIEASELDAALEWAQLQLPPMIEVWDVVTKETPHRTYTATMVGLPQKTPCETCEPCEPSATARPEHGSHVCEPCETCPPHW
jgi:hypothetical protein